MTSLLDIVFVPSTNIFKNICSISGFALNIVYYLVFVSLIVFTVFKIGMAIFRIANADSSETLEKLKENATDIILSVIGLLVVSSALFFPKLILSTAGVPDAKNPFVNFGGCGVGLIAEDSFIEAGKIAFESLPEVRGGVGGPGIPVEPEPPIGGLPVSPEVAAVLAAKELEAGIVAQYVSSNDVLCKSMGREPIAIPEYWRSSFGEWKCCKGWCPSLVLPPPLPSCEVGYKYDLKLRRCVNEGDACTWYDPITNDSNIISPPKPGEPCGEPLPDLSPNLALSSVSLCSNTPKSAPNLLNVGTFNLGGEQLGEGLSMAKLLDPSKNSLGADFDIVALQEVLVRKDGALDVSKEITDGLKSLYPDKEVYSVYVNNYGGGATGGPYGNMIISKFPISDVQTRKIDDSGGQRHYVTALIDVPGVGKVRIYDIHTRNEDACKGTAIAYDFIKDTLQPGEKFMVMGDFNLHDPIGGGCSFRVGQEKGDQDQDGIFDEPNMIYDKSMNLSVPKNKTFEPESLVSFGGIALPTVDQILVGANQGSTSTTKCSFGNYAGGSDTHAFIGGTIQL